jgi:hypothetical protein
MNATAATVLLVLVVVLIGVGSARAEQAEPSKRINAAFQTQSTLIIRLKNCFRSPLPLGWGC